MENGALVDAGEVETNASVTLTYPNGATITTTNASGIYTLANLAPTSGTTYSVSSATPSGYLISPNNWCRYY
jgi:hypothetical protein